MKLTMKKRWVFYEQQFRIAKKKRWVFEQQQNRGSKRKKMGVGQIVDQNSDEKDGCEVSNMLNSRLGL